MRIRIFFMTGGLLCAAVAALLFVAGVPPVRALLIGLVFAAIAVGTGYFEVRGLEASEAAE